VEETVEETIGTATFLGTEKFILRWVGDVVLFSGAFGPAAAGLWLTSRDRLS
jgi:hypothetical protein